MVTTVTEKCVCMLAPSGRGQPPGRCLCTQGSLVAPSRCARKSVRGGRGELARENYVCKPGQWREGSSAIEGRS